MAEMADFFAKKGWISGGDSNLYKYTDQKFTAKNSYLDHYEQFEKCCQFCTPGQIGAFSQNRQIMAKNCQILEKSISQELLAVQSYQIPHSDQNNHFSFGVWCNVCLPDDQKWLKWLKWLNFLQNGWISSHIFWRGRRHVALIQRNGHNKKAHPRIAKSTGDMDLPSA